MNYESSTSMKYNYTIIIPFRDCTETLRIACDSIPVREDIQVIVVDNAQNPIGAGVIADFKNPQIEYLTSSPTKGAGCARNVGLEKAEGKFLLFLDADDYFTPNAFELFDAELETDCDIVYFNATSVYLKSGALGNRHNGIDGMIKKSLAEGNEDVLRYHFVNPVCKMVSRELVEKHDILFQEVPASNDLMFSVKSGHFAHKVKAVDKVVYVITVGEEGSSLTKTKSLRNEEARFHVMVDWYKFLKSIGRLDLSPTILGFIRKGYRIFGLKVGLSWLFYALRNGVNIFRGL